MAFEPNKFLLLWDWLIGSILVELEPNKQHFELH